MRVALALFSVLLLVVSVSCTRRAETGLNPGDIAPPISLEDLNSNPSSLANFRGKTVLLNFWASWCAPCIEELPSLQALHTSLSGDKFIVIGVAEEEDPSLISEMRDRFGLTFPILIDPKGTAKRDYKVVGYPETFFIDPEGKIILWTDTKDGMPVTRIIGPRNWASSEVRRRLQALIAKQG